MSEHTISTDEGHKLSRLLIRAFDGICMFYLRAIESENGMLMLASALITLQWIGKAINLLR